MQQSIKLLPSIHQKELDNLIKRKTAIISRAEDIKLFQKEYKPISKEVLNYNRSITVNVDYGLGKEEKIFKIRLKKKHTKRHDSDKTLKGFSIYKSLLNSKSPRLSVKSITKIIPRKSVMITGIISLNQNNPFKAQLKPKATTSRAANKSKKECSIFEIDDSDRIFDVLQTTANSQSSTLKQHSLQKFKTIKDKDIRTNQSNSNGNSKLNYRKKLDELYNFAPDLQSDIAKVKKYKTSLDLYHYQNKLLQSIETSISKEAYKKLERTFHDLRNECNSNYEDHMIIIKDLEKQEHLAIQRINYTKNCLEKMYKTESNGFEGRKLQLKRIKFNPVFNKDLIKKPKIPFLYTNNRK